MNRYIIYIFIGLLAISCGKEGKDEAEQLAIEDYIFDNNLAGFEATDDCLFYKIDTPGDQSKKPKIGSDVLVHYHGYLTNGEVFDSSVDKGEPFRTFLNQGLIEGWRKGIPLFGEGGSGTIIVPPSLGYGSEGRGSIPGNSILIFNIEVVEVF